MNLYESACLIFKRKSEKPLTLHSANSTYDVNRNIEIQIRREQYIIYRACINKFADIYPMNAIEFHISVDKVLMNRFWHLRIL